jgi:hypothetical protein
MKGTKILVLTLILVFMATTFTYGQSQLRKPGLTGAAFLKIGVGSKMVALGSAATTIYGDPNMIFWNPAGIVTEAGETQIALNYGDWLVDFAHNAGAVTHNFGQLGTFGLGVVYMGQSDLVADRDIGPPGYEGRQPEDPGVNRFDTYDFYDLAITLAYAKQFTDRFRMGLSAKYIQEKIDTESATAIAFDFGAIYETGFRDFTLGARINNVGSDFTFYAIDNKLPLNFSVGGSMTIAGEEYTSLKGFFDLTKPQDSPQLYFVGGEWNILDRLDIRGGYKFNYSGSRDEESRIQQTDEGASFGGGLVFPYSDYEIVLDYAYTNFNVFDDTHRFSLVFSF